MSGKTQCAHARGEGLGMVQKSVSDLIFDKFAESVRKDNLFEGISDDLIVLVREKKRSKSNIEKLLKGKQDEDSESRS